MKGLLIWLAITIPTLSGALWHFGDGEELWNEMNSQEEIVEEVDYDYEELKALQKELDGLNEIDNGIEIEEYLKANNIQYTSKNVNEGMDRYINITKGNWELEVLYYKADGTCCWITLSSLLYE